MTWVAGCVCLHVCACVHLFMCLLVCVCSQEFTSQEPDVFYNIVPTICQEVTIKAVSCSTAVQRCHPAYFSLQYSTHCSPFWVALHAVCSCITSLSGTWASFSWWCPVATRCTSITSSPISWWETVDSSAPIPNKWWLFWVRKQRVGQSLKT